MSTVGVAINDNDVYVGIWTNWSRGRILGSTLTVTDRNGALLVAFLALYVSYTGTRFWRLICFILHYFLSSAEPQDGVYHQRQAILRNSTTGLQGFEQLARILWAWRKTALQLYRRTASILVISLASFLLFAVAGIFSSQVTAVPGDEVLLTGANCGVPYLWLNPDIDAVSAILSPYLTERIVASQEYGIRCYSNISSTTMCNNFVKERLPVTVVSNASCPFQSSICKEEDRNLLLDTGYLDSINDFGINTPPENRFLFRQLSHCAPILTEGYTKLDNVSDPTKPIMKYFYGKLVGVPPGYGNFSYQQPVVPFMPHEGTWGQAQADYSLGTLQAYTSSEEARSFSEFQPIEELDRTDAEVALFFLSAGDIIYSHMVDDPWFSAHQSAGSYGSAVQEGSKTFFHADEPATVLACANQEQFCRPNPGGQPICESLNDGYDHAASVQSLWPDDKKMQRYMAWSYNSYVLTAANIRTIVRQIGIATLTARFGLQSTVQGALPSDQWQKEVQNWFDASLATLQRLFVDVAAGPIDPRLDPWLSRPNSTEEHFLCRSQKVRKSGKYTSFSVLGTVIILTIGGLIIILELIVEPLTEWLKRHDTRAQYKQLEWVSNSTMQLQRLAHEELGYGNWSNTTSSVPITKYGEKLGALDVQDTSHPVLARAHIDTLMALSRETTDIQPSSSETDELPVDVSSEPESTQEEQHHESHNDLPRRASSVPIGSSSTIGRENIDRRSQARIIERIGTM
ncbi:hypothetical protein F4680DRAFT_432254 [Xylaria scruposa]|nr:hypothetical protein F4680DRAFT_432254 [Xylaria scruposa]